MAGQRVAPLRRPPQRGKGGPDGPRATTPAGFRPAPCVAMDRRCAVHPVRAASVRNTLNLVSTFLGELQCHLLPPTLLASASERRGSICRARQREGEARTRRGTADRPLLD